jgi:hypothetical protein
MAAPSFLPTPSSDLPVAELPYLSAPLLVASRSRRVCLTCHWFRHHAGPDGIPLLACQRHGGLIAHGEHLSRRCPAWTDDLQRLHGWCPEAA